MNTTYLDAALKYAAGLVCDDGAYMRMRVHPLRPGTNRPSTPGWPQRATYDNVRALWCAWGGPEYNVGIRTGLTWTEKGNPRYLCVVDIDPRNGGVRPNGWPKTRVHGTAGGGWHYLYWSDREFRKALIAPGVEFLCEAQQICAPPSTRPDGSYTVLRNSPITRMPEVLYAPVEALARARRDADGAVYIPPDQVPVGERHDALLRHIGWLCYEYPDDDIVQREAEDFFYTTCADAVEGDRELQRIIDYCLERDKLNHPERWATDA